MPKGTNAVIKAKWDSTKYENDAHLGLFVKDAGFVNCWWSSCLVVSLKNEIYKLIAIKFKSF